MNPQFHLTVQYASQHACPHRPQIRRWVATTLRHVGQDVSCAQVLLRFVDREEAVVLNNNFRGKNYATNVLTFSYQATAVVADIIVCAPIVEREADEQEKLLTHHYAHLIVHGVLHACGYDHENARDAQAMETLEAKILKCFGIAHPYWDC